MESGFQKELFSSLVSDIKNYNGEDPLCPWLKGIRKMQESLPPHVLRDKLPRFLQKCAQAFESDRRYRNDSRYLRVWIQLMDYVDDAKAILRKMEKNQIGLKRAVFYSAYALYYEKRKKYEDAEKMYHMGVQNLAQPSGELQRSYEQFLHRLKLVKKRKANLQEAMRSKGKSASNTIPTHQGEAPQNTRVQNTSTSCKDIKMGQSEIAVHTSFSNPSEVSSCNAGLVCHPCPTRKDPGPTQAKNLFRHRGNADLNLDKPTTFCSDDTIVVKFVGSAIVGKSEAEDACHHGLVDPTINTKEAMNAISSMFREPLGPEVMVKRRLTHSKPKASQQSSGFEVYVDESSEEGPNQLYNHLEVMNSDPSNKQIDTELQKPFIGGFRILADDDDDDECGGGHSGESRCMERSSQHARPVNASVYSRPIDPNFTRCDESSMISSGLREDTVVRRFVGSTVLGEPEVENACHHGLVDPTINMKEAMDDINSMFGEPLNFVRLRRSKKQSNSTSDRKPTSLGFSILADDDVGEDSKERSSSSIACKLDGDGGLFEPTVFTKEAMDEINEMFGKPLDF